MQEGGDDGSTYATTSVSTRRRRRWSLCPPACSLLDTHVRGCLLCTGVEQTKWPT